MHYGRVPFNFLCLSVACMLISTAFGAQTPRFSIRKLGPSPGTSESSGSALNDSGQVCGTSETTRAFLSSGGTTVDLPPLVFGAATRAEGLAEDGAVLGSSYSTTAREHATVWIPSEQGFVANDLGVGPGDIQSLAYAMNAGIISGLSDDGINWKPAVWNFVTVPLNHYEIQLLPFLHDDYGGIAQSVNSSGIVVGHTASAATAHAARWQYTAGAWHVTDLGALAPNLPAEALAINAGGTIVGYSMAPSTNTQHAVVWNWSGILDLGALHPGWRAVATGINDAGDIVGKCGPFGFTTAWLRLATPGITLDLNDCLPTNSAWTLVAASDINNRGRITGTGMLAGQSYAFVMTPVRGSLSAPSVGSAGQEHVFSVTNATPGGVVRFYLGRSGGETDLIAGHDTNLDIAQAVGKGRALAGVDGTASFSFHAPLSFAGHSYLFQTWDTASGGVSNVVTVRF
jgi:probable HAF family extracellular repeat protein